MQTAERRQLREEQRRLRDLERQAKEQAKLSAIEQAHLEVETFNNRLAALLSVHKEQGGVWDWVAVASSLPPPPPKNYSSHEQRARQCLCVMPSKQQETSELLIDQARLYDEQEFQSATKVYSDEMVQWEKLKKLARRILDGDHKAYTEALVEFNPFAEMSDLGSSIHFTVHNRKLAECVLKVNGRQAIPTEVKTLTSSEKVSIKPMAKGRFHEIYQDYICGCVLRVAREIFALLPVDAVLVTAAADSVDTRTGRISEQSVLSVFIPCADLARLNLDQLHPSDAIENFQHRGDFKASRKTEAFQPIMPLTLADIAVTPIEDMGYHDLLANVQRIREELKAQIAELSRGGVSSIQQANSRS